MCQSPDLLLIALYVPVLMITHVVAFYLLLRPQPKTVSGPRRACGIFAMIRVMAVPQERGVPAWSVRLAADLDANDQAVTRLGAGLAEEPLN
jgi:hypothetical protein